MTEPRHSEAAFESVIEQHLLGAGLCPVSREFYDRKKAVFPSVVLEFIRETQPNNIAQKTEVMVEHFHAVTHHNIGGRTKAMVVTGSRLEAVCYKQSFDRIDNEIDTQS